MKEARRIWNLPPDEPIEVVHGNCRGVDRSAKYWAHSRGFRETAFPYKSKFGKAGGPLRNTEMADYGDRALLFWDGRSRGTADIGRKLRARGKPFLVQMFDPPEDFGYKPDA